jgi:hypothetical protein
MTIESTSVRVPPRKAENNGRRTAALPSGPSLGRKRVCGASTRCRLDDNKKPVERV